MWLLPYFMGHLLVESELRRTLTLLQWRGHMRHTSLDSPSWAQHLLIPSRVPDMWVKLFWMLQTSSVTSWLQLDDFCQDQMEQRNDSAEHCWNCWLDFWVTIKCLQFKLKLSWNKHLCAAYLKKCTGPAFVRFVVTGSLELCFHVL